MIFPPYFSSEYPFSTTFWDGYTKLWTNLGTLRESNIFSGKPTIAIFRSKIFQLLVATFDHWRVFVLTNIGDRFPFSFIMTLIIAIHPYCWWLHQFHMFHSILPPWKYRHKIHMFCWWSRPFSPSNPLSLLNLIFHFHPFPIKNHPIDPPFKATFHGSAPTCVPQRSGCLSATSQTRCPRCQESGAQKRQQGPSDRDRPTAENHGCTTSRGRFLMGSDWILEDCSWDFTA